MQATKTKQGIDVRKMRKARSRLRAANHPLRWAIMTYLKREGVKTVTELWVAFRIEQSVMSQHLAILRRAKLVSCNKSGKEHYYSLDIDGLYHFNKAISNFSNSNK